MGEINLQFHAKREEIIDLIKKSMISFDLNMIAVKIYPSFEREIISLVEFSNKVRFIDECKMIFLCKSVPNELPIDYMRFLDENKDCLVFSIGEQSDSVLKESAISTITEDAEILKLWKKIINNFKKNMLKGAWVINPQNSAKEFYKNHYYTLLAQKAFQDGCKLAPSTGWTEYYLSHEYEE